MNSRINFMIKRFFDIFFAVICLIFLSIPLFVLGLIIKLSSGGPVIFWTKRVGRNNKIFLMAKFRTMKVDAPVISSILILNEDKYFNAVGKFLRKYGIDELPQLYNIIKGDMSFVGPRPVINDEYELIDMRCRKKICLIKPGLTGLAQINGRHLLKNNEKIKYDEIYMRNMNLFLDIKIIMATLICVLNNKLYFTFNKKKIRTYKRTVLEN